MGFSMNLGSLIVRLVGDNTKLANSLRQAESMMDRTSKKFKSIGKSLTKNLTVPLTAVGLASLKAFSNFDGAMTQSLAIMQNVSPKLRQEMEMTAKTLSSTGVQSATELAQAYFYLASAGLSAEQSIASLSTVQNFATAGMFDMSRATDLLTDAQSALGLTVKDSAKNMKNMERVSNVLVRANILANATVEQFSTALTSKAATAMRSYNIELEEGVSVLAVYADQGIKAQLAGNMFDRMIRLLIKSVNENADAWDKLNIVTTQANGNLLPLADIIEQVTEATADMGATTKSAALSLLGFEARAQGAILPLLGTSEAMREYEKNLKKGLTAQEIAKRQLQSFGSQMKILWNNVKLVGIQIGKILAPVVIFLGKKIKDLAGWFTELSDNTKKWIIGIAAATAALGPLLIAMGTLVILTKVLFKLLILYGPFIVLFGAIAIAIWGIIDAVTDTNLGFIKLFDNITIGGLSLLDYMKLFSNLFWNMWEYVTSKVGHFFSAMWEGIKEGGRKLKRFILTIGKAISSIFWTVVNGVIAAIAFMIRKSANALARVRGVSQKTIDSMLNAAASMQQKAGEAAAKSAAYYDKKIKDSLDSSQKSAEIYYAAIDKLEKKYQKQTVEFAKEREKIFIRAAAKVKAGEKGSGDSTEAVPETGGGGIVFPDFGGMINKAKEYINTLYEMININQQYISQIQSMTPSVNVFSESFGTLMDLATDPEVQALAQVNEELNGLFESRLGMLNNYAVNHQAIMKQIAESEVNDATKSAAQMVAINDYKNRVLLSGTAQLMGMIASALTNGGKKNFKLYKALAMTEAGIATYTAFNKALAAGPGPPSTIPMASAVLGMGLLKVRQIAMMKPGSGMSGAGGGSTGGFTTNQTGPGIDDIEKPDEEEKPDKYTIIIENINGSADEEFADMLAQSLADRSIDGRNYGFETTTR